MAATAPQVIETGNALRDRRLALGLSQIALGILADCGLGAVQRWESVPRAERQAAARRSGALPKTLALAGDSAA